MAKRPPEGDRGQNRRPGKGSGAPLRRFGRGGFFGNFLSAVLVLLTAGLLYSFVTGDSAAPTEIPVSELAADIAAGKVIKLAIVSGAATATYATSTPPAGAATSSAPAAEERLAKFDPNASLAETLVGLGVSPEALSKVSVLYQPEEGGGWVVASTLLSVILPLLLIALTAWYIVRQVRGAGTQAMTFGQSRARLVDPKDNRSRVTFADVAGCREAKQELSEIVDFLKSPKKFLEIGARIPKGILLMGAPGTGKTLLARATAGEAGVAFFSISGSEFVELFVGVGASRVRDLFKMAKDAAPAIVFIDEIDAVGRSRGVGTGGGNDEREQTLNQILVEMDGFEPNEAVIVMAATNRPDVLDTAILRPGRFDRRVVIDLPDRRDREEILLIQAKGKPLAEDVGLKLIADRTPGFSGADLYSLVNEAAILAAREGRKTVAQFDLIRSIEKVLLGPERRSHLLGPAEREIVAFHEAVHAVVSTALAFADPVHKVSIVSRGRAGGYTLKLPEEDKRLHSRKEFEDDIASTFGGYAAEKMIFGDTTTGPSNDLQVATAMARDMVTKYGMSEKIGPVALEGEMGRTLFGRGIDGEQLSERVAAEVDGEVKRILDRGMERAKEVLTKHRAALDAVAARLLEKETVERDDYEALVAAHGMTVKPKKDIEHRGAAEGGAAANAELFGAR